MTNVQNNMRKLPEKKAYGIIDVKVHVNIREYVNSHMYNIALGTVRYIRLEILLTSGPK